MVFLSLQPNPLINSGRVETFVGQSCREIAIWKIRIQPVPRTRDGVEPQICNRDQQSDTFNPGNDMLNPQCGHIPWSYRERSLVVSDLSLNRRQNVPILRTHYVRASSRCRRTNAAMSAWSNN